MKFESIHGLPVALGVDWYALPDNESGQKKYLSTLLKSSRATNTILLDLESRLYYGLTSTKGHRKVPRQFASALAWFAMTRPLGQGPEAIVWVQGDGSRTGDVTGLRAWVAGVIDGAPMNRCDKLVKITDVSATLMEMFGDHSPSLKVYVCGFPEHNFGIFGEYYQDFRELVETQIAGLFPQECPPPALMKATGLSPLAVKAVSATFLLLMIGGGTAGYMYYLEVQEQERLAEEARLRALAAAQPKPEEVYARSFATYFTSGFKRVPAAEAAKLAFATFKSVNMAERGWIFSEFICTTRTLPGTVTAPNTISDPQCQIEYKRKPEAAPLPMNASDYVTIDKQVEAVKARKPFAAALATIDGNVKPSEIMARFAPSSAIDGVLKVLRQAKDHDLKVYFQPPNKLPPESNKLPPVANNGTPFEVKTGTWSVSGPMELYEMLYDLPPSAFIHSVRVYEDKRTLQFKAEGNYYVADLIGKKPMPALAALPIPNTPVKSETPIAPAASVASVAPATPVTAPAATAKPALPPPGAVASVEPTPRLPQGSALGLPTAPGAMNAPLDVVTKGTTVTSNDSTVPKLTTPFTNK